MIKQVFIQFLVATFIFNLSFCEINGRARADDEKLEPAKSGLALQFTTKPFPLSDEPGSPMGQVETTTFATDNPADLPTIKEGVQALIAQNPGIPVEAIIARAQDETADPELKKLAEEIVTPAQIREVQTQLSAKKTSWFDRPENKQKFRWIVSFSRAFLGGGAIFATLHFVQKAEVGPAMWVGIIMGAISGFVQYHKDRYYPWVTRDDVFIKYLRKKLPQSWLKKHDGEVFERRVRRAEQLVGRWGLTEAIFLALGTYAMLGTGTIDTFISEKTLATTSPDFYKAYIAEFFRAGGGFLFTTASSIASQGVYDTNGKELFDTLKKEETNNPTKLDILEHTTYALGSALSLGAAALQIAAKYMEIEAGWIISMGMFAVLGGAGYVLKLKTNKLKKVIAEAKAKLTPKGSCTAVVNALSQPLSDDLS